MEHTTFASDNYSAIHTPVIKYLSEINRGHAASYGSDEITKKAISLFKEVFGDVATTVFTANGTGANILSLRLLLTRPYEAVITTDVSHIFEEETGALSALANAQNFTVPHTSGKMDVGYLQQEVILRNNLEFHSAIPKVVSIASPTEYGTIYTLEEIRTIAQFCHANDLYLHVDGCRLPNALAALKCTAKEYIYESGVDILSFGGAKNGLLNAEAVVIFNAPDSDIRRLQKQTLQLTSKMRYLSGQFIPYFENNLWLHSATHSNALAASLAKQLCGLLKKDVLTQPLETNQVFCKLPPKVRHHLGAAGHRFYDWNDPDEVRFVTSWDNTKEDVDKLLALIKASL